MTQEGRLVEIARRQVQTGDLDRAKRIVYFSTFGTVHLLSLSAGREHASSWLRLCGREQIPDKWMPMGGSRFAHLSSHTLSQLSSRESPLSYSFYHSFVEREFSQPSDQLFGRHCDKDG
jgi:hypothetical protein